MVAACSTNRVIGVDGKLPWKIPEDTRRLMQLIKGGVVIHGRRYCYCLLFASNRLIVCLAVSIIGTATACCLPK